MLLWLTSTQGNSDDYPTDMDLQVAYCEGAAEAGLELPMNKSTATLYDLLARRKEHFTSYLSSRGYADRKDISSLALAGAQGRADLKLSESVTDHCVAECQRDPLPTDPKLKSKAIEDVLGCGKACMIRSTDGRSEKLRMCEDVERSLPF